MIKLQIFTFFYKHQFVFILGHQVTAAHPSNSLMPLSLFPFPYSLNNQHSSVRKNPAPPLDNPLSEMLSLRHENKVPLYPRRMGGRPSDAHHHSGEQYLLFFL